MEAAAGFPRIAAEGLDDLRAQLLRLRRAFELADELPGTGPAARALGAKLRRELGDVAADLGAVRREIER
jgi:hypothetical protein